MENPHRVSYLPEVGEMKAPAPRVSIGLPVYNGERYLRESIDAVIAQTFPDWELIISDNASTDATASISKAYAEQDQRIRYHRNAENIGAAANHNLTATLARGDYFKFYASDDVLLPEYLARCLEVLNRDPELVSCHSKTMIMDADGHDIHPDPWHLRTDSPDPRTRFHDIVWVPHHTFLVYGLIRRELLFKTPLLRPHLSGDQVMMAELSLYGRFHTVPEFLFRSRRHKQQSVALVEDYWKGRKIRLKWLAPRGVPHSFHHPKSGWKVDFPMWRGIREYFEAPWRTPASLSVKLWCTANIACYTVRNCHKLARDIVLASYQTWLRIQHRYRKRDPNSAVAAGDPQQKAS